MDKVKIFYLYQHIFVWVRGIIRYADLAAFRSGDCDLTAMKKSAVDGRDILSLIKNALTTEIDDREIFMKGIDYSYYYEEIDEE